MQRLSITIPEEIAKKINKKVAKGERSNFIVRAICEALAKEEKSNSLRKIKEFKPFDVSRDSTEVLEQIRNKI